MATRHINRGALVGNPDKKRKSQQQFISDPTEANENNEQHQQQQYIPNQSLASFQNISISNSNSNSFFNAASTSSSGSIIISNSATPEKGFSNNADVNMMTNPIAGRPSIKKYKHRHIPQSSIINQHFQQQQQQQQQHFSNLGDDLAASYPPIPDDTSIDALYERYKCKN